MHPPAPLGVPPFTHTAPWHCKPLLYPDAHRHHVFGCSLASLISPVANPTVCTTSQSGTHRPVATLRLAAGPHTHVPLLHEYLHSTHPGSNSGCTGPHMAPFCMGHVLGTQFRVISLTPSLHTHGMTGPCPRGNPTDAGCASDPQFCDIQALGFPTGGEYLWPHTHVGVLILLHI